MNKDQAKKAVGHHVRVRPIAKRFEGPKELPAIDDDWLVNSVDNGQMRLSNLRTEHVAILGLDHIHSYLSDPARNRGGAKYGFLQLRVQLSLLPNDLRIEPLPPGVWQSS